MIETDNVRLAAYALLRGARLATRRSKQGGLFRLEAPRAEELEADFYHFGPRGVDEELMERNVRLLAERAYREGVRG